jgi:hypothetical protein
VQNASSDQTDNRPAQPSKPPRLRRNNQSKQHGRVSNGAPFLFHPQPIKEAI